ncbi:MAG: polysaccharide deacetylase family protein [Planctomycetota bacterium]
MSKWKTRLIEMYRCLSIPYRQARYVRMVNRGQVPVIVLFYHRVSDQWPNRWTISCKDFERQINWLESTFEIVDLNECQRRIESGHNSVPTLAITFDDGYAENCEFALPLLIERRIPVTYFVTTQHTVYQQPFQHDLDVGQRLATNTIESLRALDLAGVEIGAHTRTHPDLGAIKCPQKLVDELVHSSNEVSKRIGRKIQHFAFPFGQLSNLNRDAFRILKEAGFKSVCSAYGGWNAIGQESFHLQRLHGDPNFSRIRNWLTFDPRIDRVKRFDYSGSQLTSEEIRKLIRDVPPISQPPGKTIVPADLSDPLSASWMPLEN